MRCVNFFVAVLVFLVSAALSVRAQENNQQGAAAVRTDAGKDIPSGSETLQTAVTETTGIDGAEAPLEKRFIAPVGPDGVQQAEIRAGDYYFDPNYIVVKANVPVALRAIKARGLAPHTLIIKDPDAGMDFKLTLNDERYETVRFTPVKTGRYEMYCDKKFLFFKSHKDRGMHGVIEVVP